MYIEEHYLYGLIGISIGLIIGFILLFITILINNANIKSERKYQFEKEKYFIKKQRADKILMLMFEFTNNVMSFIKSNLKSKNAKLINDIREIYDVNSQKGFDALFEAYKEIYMYFPEMKYAFRNYFNMAKKLNEKYGNLYLRRKSDLDQDEIDSFSFLLDSLNQKNLKINESFNKELKSFKIE